MAETLLTIQHNDHLFSPPIESGVKIEWERTGSPGKLTFTTVKTPNQNMSFFEGDPVIFYYGGKPIFMGYVFTKKRDREHRIQVTCYDQIRYLKNKYTYVFENKTATQIIKALCNDFNLNTGSLQDTKYVIPAIAEENSAAIDIALKVLEETLTNTGNMFILFDNAGKIEIKNSADMVSTTLIMEETAENFDYSSSIDDETYNNVILYYKEENNDIRIYQVNNGEKIKQWGELRYFEEVKNKTIAANKAKSLLQLYCRKTRELKVTGAFGDPTVRGGTLIPVKLNLGDIITNNYMLVEKVTHNFENDHYTMDLTLQGAWDNNETGGYSTVKQYLIKNSSDEATGGSGGGSGGDSGSQTNKVSGEMSAVTIKSVNGLGAAGDVRITYYDGNGNQVTTTRSGNENFTIQVAKGTKVSVTLLPRGDTQPKIQSQIGSWSGSGYVYTTNAGYDKNSTMSGASTLTVWWPNQAGIDFVDRTQPLDPPKVYPNTVLPAQGGR